MFKLNSLISSDVAPVLINEGADLVAESSVEGHTALNLAAFYGNLEFAKLLVECGAKG